MRKYIYSFLIASISSASIGCNGDLSKSSLKEITPSTNAIIDGQILEEKHPLHKSVLTLQITQKEYDTEVDYNCTATAIGKRLILTAAHCFTENTFKSKIIIQNENRPNITIPVEDYKTHKKYDIHTHDIAIALLKKDLPENIIPVTLVDSLEKMNVQKIIIAGYGLTEKDPVINGFRRNKTLNDHLIIGDVSLETRTTYSLVFNEKSKSHSCFGDSGGPAFIETSDNKYIQIGISKYVLNPDCEGEFHYESIFPHLKWIQDTMELLKTK